MRAVTIELPENILLGSGQSREEFAREAKLLLRKASPGPVLT
jgi:hypothetical protein